MRVYGYGLSSVDTIFRPQELVKLRRQLQETTDEKTMKQLQQEISTTYVKRKVAVARQVRKMCYEQCTFTLGIVWLSLLLTQQNDAVLIISVRGDMYITRLRSLKVTGQCSAHARKLLRMPYTSQCT